MTIKSFALTAAAVAALAAPAYASARPEAANGPHCAAITVDADLSPEQQARLENEETHRKESIRLARETLDAVANDEPLLRNVNSVIEESRQRSESGRMEPASENIMLEGESARSMREGIKNERSSSISKIFQRIKDAFLQQKRHK